MLISLVQNLPVIIAEIVKAVPQIVTGIVRAFADGVGRMKEVGVNLVKGLWEGIQSLAGWLWDKVSGWAGDLWDGICDFFGIHSPSRKMAWVGDMLMTGLAGGIDASSEDAVSAAQDTVNSLNSVFDGLSADMQTVLPEAQNPESSGRRASTATPATVGGFVLQLSITNFNNYSGEDISELTEEIMQTAGAFVKRKGAVFA